MQVLYKVKNAVESARTM